MDSNSISNTSMIFDNSTKNICIYCFVSIILIILFIMTPLRQYTILSNFIKIISILLLGYCIYLNNIQIKNLSTSDISNSSSSIKGYINANIFFSYIFSISMLIFVYFIIKSFWN